MGWQPASARSGLLYPVLLSGSGGHQARGGSEKTSAPAPASHCPSTWLPRPGGGRSLAGMGPGPALATSVPPSGPGRAGPTAPHSETPTWCAGASGVRSLLNALGRAGSRLPAHRALPRMPSPLLEAFVSGAIAKQLTARPSPWEAPGPASMTELSPSGAVASGRPDGEWGPSTCQDSGPGQASERVCCLLAKRRDGTRAGGTPSLRDPVTRGPGGPRRLSPGGKPWARSDPLDQAAPLASLWHD